MNNSQTNVYEIIRSKLEGINKLLYDSNNSNDYTFMCRLRNYIVQNTSNEQLIRINNHDGTLIFQNINTKKFSTVSLGTDENHETLPLLFLPSYGEANSYLPTSDENAEAIALRISRGIAICIRVNKNGLFIENYDIESGKIRTEYYDQKALSSMLPKEYDNLSDNHLTLITLLEKAGGIDNLNKSIIYHNFDLNPDSIIEVAYEISDDRYVVQFKKNNEIIDQAIISVPIYNANYHKYGVYIGFMIENGLYMDTHSPLRARKH